MRFFPPKSNSQRIRCMIEWYMIPLPLPNLTRWTRSVQCWGSLQKTWKSQWWIKNVPVSDHFSNDRGLRKKVSLLGGFWPRSNDNPLIWYSLFEMHVYSNYWHTDTRACSTRSRCNNINLNNWPAWTIDCRKIHFVCFFFSLCPASMWLKICIL